MQSLQLNLTDPKKSRQILEKLIIECNIITYLFPKFNLQVTLFLIAYNLRIISISIFSLKKNKLKIYR